MSKTLSTNVTNGKAGSSEPVYLVYMDLGGGTILRLGTKATSTITGWSGDAFSGGYLEELGVIDMDIDLDGGPNIYSTYDWQFSLLNQDNYQNTLLGYNFYNRTVEVRLIFADQTSPSWANAVKLFKGIVFEWWYDKNRITIKCTSNDKKWFANDLPLNTFNNEDFPYCDESVLGSRRPLVWGEFAAPGEFTNAGGDFVKAYLVDKNFRAYVCADHEIASDPIPIYWDSGLLQACLVEGTIVYSDGSSGVSVTLPELNYFILLFKNVQKISRVSSVLRAADGNDFIDAYKIMDMDSDTFVNLSASTAKDVLKLIMKDVTIDEDCDIWIWIEAEWSSAPTDDILRIDVYADNFNDFVAARSVNSDEVLGSKADIGTAWKASSGRDMGLWIRYDDGADSVSVDLKECFIRFSSVNVGEFPAIMYASLEGMLFGSWIVYGNRNNGYSELDVITPGSYVVESIFHILGLTDSQINYDSFDAAGNDTNGTRKDWKLAGQLNDATSARSLLKQMMMEHGAIIFENTDGEIELKPVTLSPSSGGTITGVSILIDTETNESTLKRSLTSLDNVYNSFEVHYKHNYATGKYDEMLYCDRNGKSSGVASGYDTKCSTSYTKYSVEKKLIIQAKWIRDSATAIKLIEFLVDWFTNRREIVEFDTGLGLVDLELGDIRTINNSFVNDTYMLTGIKHDCDRDVIHLKWIEV
jgi:hypothetical protein